MNKTMTLMGGVIVDTTFQIYGSNNVQIWSTDWVSNSGKVEYSFLVIFSQCLVRFNWNFRLTFNDNSESE